MGRERLLTWDQKFQKNRAKSAARMGIVPPLLRCSVDQYPHVRPLL